MAAYSDTVESEGVGETSVDNQTASASATYEESAAVLAAILSTQFAASVTVESEGAGADLHFYFDELQSDGVGEALVTNERRDLLASITSAAKAASVVDTQRQDAVSPVLQESAAGDGVFVRSGRRIYADILNEASAHSPIARQEKASADTLAASAYGASAIAAEVLQATDTVVGSAAGADTIPPFFSDAAAAEGTVVRAELRLRHDFTEKAAATSTLVSDKAASLFRDLVEAAGYGASSVQSDTLTAAQLLVDSAEAVDELLNVLAEEAWVFNSWTLAFSRYVGLSVNDVGDVEGKPYFTSPTGLYEFSGADFSDGLIQFGLTNMGAMAPKRMRAVYVSTAGKGTIKMSTFHGEQGALVETKYATPERESATPINRRISPARGHQGQYWGFKVEIVDGRQQVSRIHVLPLITGRNL